MQKKQIIATILIFSIFFGSCVPVFASTSTPSAFKLSSTGTRATSPSTTVEPEDSSTTVYRLGSTGQVSSATETIATWGDMAKHLMFSITWNFKRVYDLINNDIVGNSTNNSGLFDIRQTLQYIMQTLWSSNSSNTMPLFDMLEQNLYWILSDLEDPNGNQYLPQILTKLTNTYSYLSGTISTFLNNTEAYTEQILDSLAYWDQNGFNQTYFWKKWLTGSSVQLNTINANGDLNSTNRFDFGNNSILGGIEAILYYYGNGLVTSASRITQHVVDSSYANDDYLYDKDLVSTNMSKDSLWSNIRDIGSNLSLHLSRLDYVLASDDEIAARQAAAANQDAAVDNFISSNGSGSASTTDLGDMASGSSAIKNALSSNADIDDAFGIFDGDTSVWDWFTQETKASFDNVSLERSSVDIYTHYVDSFYSEVLEGIHANIK